MAPEAPGKTSNSCDIFKGRGPCALVKARTAPAALRFTNVQHTRSRNQANREGPGTNPGNGSKTGTAPSPSRAWGGLCISGRFDLA